MWWRPFGDWYWSWWCDEGCLVIETGHGDVMKAVWWLRLVVVMWDVSWEDSLSLLATVAVYRPLYSSVQATVLLYGQPRPVSADETASPGLWWLPAVWHIYHWYPSHPAQALVPSSACEGGAQYSLLTSPLAAVVAVVVGGSAPYWLGWSGGGGCVRDLWPVLAAWPTWTQWTVSSEVRSQQTQSGVVGVNGTGVL